MARSEDTGSAAGAGGRVVAPRPSGWSRFWRVAGFFYGLPVFKAARSIHQSATRMSRMVGGLWERPQGVVVDLRGLSSPRGILLIAVAGVMIGSAVLLGLRTAEAQVFGQDVFDTVDQASRELLSFLDGGDGDEQYQALGTMVFYFNLAVFSLAGVLLVWHAMTAVVDTGRKGVWGIGAWELVRIVVAAALMFPIPGGPSPGQHVVLKLAGLGGDFAQGVWEPFSTKLLGSAQVVAPRTGEAVRRTLVAELMMVEACHAFAGKGGRITRRTQSGTLKWSYLLARGSRGYDSSSHCGEVRFPGVDLGGHRGDVAEAHVDGADEARLILREAAKEMAATYDYDEPASYGRAVDENALRGAIDRALQAYSAKVDTVVEQSGEAWHRDVVEELTREEAQESSWTKAGSVFSAMAMRIGEFNWSVVSGPEVTGPMLALKDQSKRAFLVVSKLSEDIARIAGTPVSAIGTVSPDAGSVGGGVSGALAQIFGALFFSFEDVIDVGEENPLLDLATIGHNMLSYVMVSIAALMKVALVSNLGDTKIFGFGLPLDFFEAVYPVVDGLITMILTVVVMAGAILAYVVPALPFIRFLFAMLGWIVEVVEGFVAMTVWLAAHLVRTEGGGLMTGATVGGLQRLAGVVLRPPLMVLGLVIGYFIFQVLVGLLNIVWMPYMKASTGDAGPGLVGFAALFAIYVMVAYGLLNASMRTIEAVPDAVMEWIGGRARGWAGADQVLGNMSGGAGRLSGFGPRMGGGRRGGGGSGDGAGG